MKHQDLINACREDWQAYTQHAFVQQLAQGTLPQSCYLHYLKQDFLFLKQYACIKYIASISDSTKVFRFCFHIRFS